MSVKRKIIIFAIITILVIGITIFIIKKIHQDSSEGFNQIDSNYFLIERKKGLFENRNDDNPISFITSQYVSIIERQNNWILIDWYSIPKWIDLDFLPSTNELTEILMHFGETISIYFENLETGFIFGYNAEIEQFSASVTKASFALYLYNLAEQGIIDLDTYLEYTPYDVNTGSGIIWTDYEIGTKFTKRELVRLNLSYSDNIATTMLRRNLGTNGYREFIRNIGGNPNFVGENIFNSILTANETGLFAREIFKYIESNRKYSEEFKKALLNNQFPFIISDYQVASKSGWRRPNAWHDMAIIYAPSPFVLVILSTKYGWSDQDFDDFAEITRVFQEFNNTWF